MEIKTIKTDIFLPQGDLLSFLDYYLKDISEGDILVVTSKIVSLAEGRIVSLSDELTKDKIIRQEGTAVIATSPVYLTLKDGMIMANAGVDESNGNGSIILLPTNSYWSAENICKFFKEKYSLSDLGVIITDSRCLPLRAGTVGVALGYAGFKGLKQYKGQPDIFGRILQYARVDVADSLAAAAVLGMGEGNEKQPLAVIRGAAVEFISRVEPDELLISLEEDIYGPLFKKIPAGGFDKTESLN